MKNILAISILLTTTNISFGQQIHQSEVYTYANATIVEELFDAKEISYDAINLNNYLATINGFKVLVTIDDGNLFLMTYFSGEVTLDSVNDINSKYRWIRAYLDNDRDLIVESGLNFTGGVTVLNINSFINNYEAFLEEIMNN